MKSYVVTMWENGQLIEVWIRNAKSAAAATRAAQSLCPDAAHLTTQRKLRAGVAA